VRVLIAGAGFVGGALAEQLAAAGHEAVALRRSAAAPPPGATAVAGDVTDPKSLRALGAFDAVVYAAAPDARSEAAYRACYLAGVYVVLDAVPCERFLLTSSTSVYAQDAGEWVDETSPTEPVHFTGRTVLAGERAARELHPHASSVRFGGLYGPGRSRLLAAAREGRLAYAVDPPRYTNRIHRDDAAGLLAHLLTVKDLAPAYVGVDCDPAGEETFYRWLAERVGGPKPQASSEAGTGAGKRASNRLALASGYRFRFPTFREGYGALAVGGGPT
jgi:nucleoside-diphosphate-sugar epimerase